MKNDQSTVTKEGDRLIFTHPTKLISTSQIMDFDLYMLVQNYKKNNAKYSQSASEYIAARCGYVAKEINASLAVDANINVGHLNGTLEKYQLVVPKELERREKIILGDLMGLGKTIESIASAAYLGSFPVVVVCPASLKTNWCREISKWYKHANPYIVQSKSEDIPAGHNFYILSYNISASPAVVEQLLAQHPRLLVCDEAHYLLRYKAASKTVVVGKKKSSGGSQRSDMCYKMSQKIKYLILATGTPIKIRNKDVVHLLRMTDKLGFFGGEWAFLNRYCDPQKKVIGKKPTGELRYATNFDGSVNTEELFYKLRQSCLIRRTKKDTGMNSTKQTIHVIYIDIPNMDEYHKAEDDLVQFIRGQGTLEYDKEFLESIAALPEEEQLCEKDRYALEKSKSAQRAEHLVKVSVLRKVLIKGKMDYIKEWAQEFSQNEKLVGVFIHRDPIVELAKELGTHLTIMGGISSAAKQDGVDKFQNNPDEKLMLLNISAGGVGFTLHAAHTLFFAELSWVPSDHAQAACRIDRRGQLFDMDIYYFIAANTREEVWVKELIEKQNNADQALDGKTGGIYDKIMLDLLRTRRKLDPPRA